MIGETLGHFRILEMIGAGGMGVVYRAHDERLDRDVALKVLPPGTLADETTRKRFRLEALTLSRLNHPNIATVHDFNDQGGSDFLVMELIQGGTLDDKICGAPLPEREVLRLGVQLAQGLGAAHGEGVVHRDLKPGNVRITPDGRLKILDFGLATLRRLEWNERADTSDLGDNAMVAGSPPYMAPEQLMGEVVDARCDIYGAGAILYEMVTGRRPFAESHGPRLIDAVLHAPPVPPRDLNARLSPGLESIVLKCLDKDPARRYQSARELLVDLERLSVPISPVTRPQPRAQRRHTAWASLSVAAVTAVLIGSGPVARGFFGKGLEGAPVKSLVVLPLQNLSGDPAQEYFADGLTERLIADLAQVGSLRVISRTSSMHYKGSQKTLREIADALDVEAVVEGSIVRMEDQVRITAQLVHVASDHNLWARTFEGRAEDVLDLQREVARSVVREVNAKLTQPERERLAGAGPVDPEAYEAYLRGRHHAGQVVWEMLLKASASYEHAIARSPEFALAHVGWADAQTLLAGTAFASAEETAPRVRAALDRALAIDPNLAEAHSSRAYAAFVLDRKWTEAEAGFRKALKLNPNLAQAHEEYGWYLTALGRLEEAQAEMARAKLLDPLSPQVNVGVATVLMYQRKLDEARTQFTRTLELDPHQGVVRYALARIDVMQGRPERAVETLESVLASTSRPAYMADLAHAYAASGRRDDALRTLTRWRELAGRHSLREEQAAHVYAALGDKREAVRLLERAYAARSPGLVWLKVDPRFDSIHSDPGFRDLLKKLNLPS
jgi:serine/threonine protein kinase/Tfp pilus assembly protein PilF